MKFQLVINVSEETYQNYNVSFFETDEKDVIRVIVDLLPDQKIEDVLSKSNITSTLASQLEALLLDYVININIIRIITSFLETNIDILANTQSLIIDTSKEILDFLHNNPKLLEYSIIIAEYQPITREALKNIKASYGNMKNVFVYIDGNQEPVTIDEYEQTVLAIEEIVNKIKKYNLSQLEQVMYAYDLVRNRVFKAEDEKDAYSVSRDLTAVLLGDKIVCLGFANIFNQVLENLGIKSQIFNLKKKSNPTLGHARNMVYLKDTKYDVEGVYFFDTTWDSKRNENDVAYLNSYRFFAKSKDDIDIYSMKYNDLSLAGFDASTVWEFEEIVTSSDITKVPKEMLKTINDVAMFIDGKPLINSLLTMDIPIDLLPDFAVRSFDFKNTMAKLLEYKDLFFENFISPETFMKVLFEVRKIEYYEEPDVYPFDAERLKCILSNSDWIIAQKARFLNAILGGKRHISLTNHQMVDSFYEQFSNENGIARRIMGVKLVRTLRKVVEK